ncbi:MAG: M1 family metallopeptidase [Ilumatobacteraceae bacterium]|nr:M1 family metallopeptidase [Ilumatobacteraceae bacterium]
MTVISSDTLDPYRLPRHTTPDRYDLTLEPDLDAGTFAGSVSITVTSHEATDELVLNAIELDIDRCTVDGEPAATELDESTERLFVRPTDGVAAGAHTLVVEFRGILNDKLRGFYRSTYRDDEGVERVIATTQMQSTDCRRAFPCWDEPDFKAIFAVTLRVEPEMMAVSNGSILSEEESDGKRVVRFADTMVMSSYLVAFVVGPLEATDWHDADGIPVRIVHVPGKGDLTAFGLDVATFCLAWFQDYYGIPYPSDKVDLLALPDFAAGAMENLGCITFRENLLLVHPTAGTQSERQLVADVVAHELAHMWFGDLVTMSWWNGIWLNEAFATFMEIAACDAFRPEWERWTYFGLERSVAFETDALGSTRSVEFKVRSPADCEGMFDVLTYQKGGALLRMLEQYLGAERFREGVSHYLRTHSYANTETGDLWDAIEHTSGEPVRRIMDSWIWQPGFPLVEVTAAGDELVLTQRRFSFDPDDASTSRWAIPVAVQQGDHVDTVLLDGDELRLPLGDGPVIVNAGGHGFFRVSYSDDLRARLTPEVVASMTTLERYNLVDDAWNAVTAQTLDAADFLDLAELFGGEREYGVWQVIAIGLRGLRRLIVDDAAALAAFERRVVALCAPALDDLGEPTAEDTDLTAKLRGLLLSVVAVTGGDADAQARARRIYDDWSSDPDSVDAELAAASTAVVAATGDAADYDRMLEQYRSGATPQIQLRHLHLLPEFRGDELMARTLGLAMSDEVKTQNAPFVLRTAIGNLHHGRTAWEFVRQNWADINDAFPRNTISRIVETVKSLDRPADVAQTAAFFAEHPIEQAAKTLDQILERQRVNAEVRERNEQPFRDALR